MDILSITLFFFRLYIFKPPEDDLGTSIGTLGNASLEDVTQSFGGGIIFTVIFFFFLLQDFIVEYPHCVIPKLNGVCVLNPQ